MRRRRGCGIRLECFSLNRGMKDEYSLTRGITTIIIVGVSRISERTCRRRCYGTFTTSLRGIQRTRRCGKKCLIAKNVLLPPQRRIVRVKRRVYYVFLIRKDILRYRLYRRYLRRHEHRGHSHYKPISRDDD